MSFVSVPLRHIADRRLSIALLAARTSIHTVRWANALAGRGHEVHVLSSHRGGDPLDERVRTHLLPVPAPAGYTLNLPFVKRVLRRLRPDVLHAHFASGYGTLGRLSGYGPLVMSTWGSDVYEFPDKSPFHRRVVGANLRAADRVCSTSHAMAARTQAVQPLDRLTVVPFGIDTERFRPDRDAADADFITIGTVKALNPKYGIDVLLRAFAHLRGSTHDTSPERAHRLRLLVVGGGPDRAALEMLAAALGVADCTEFVGPVPHHAVPAMLNRLDVYVAASRQESFGVAALEASACGVPVVVSDAGGLPEVVVNGVTGLVVGREDVEATAAAIRRLVEDAALRRTMGAAGRRQVIDHYQWSANVATMEAVYYEVLSQYVSAHGTLAE